MAKVLTRAAEKRVTLTGLSWDAYAQVREALGSSRSARLTYDQGRLEITMPLEEHETAAEWIALLIRHWVRATGRKLKTLGSTTLERPDLNRGAEPDKAFYIQNYDKVAGKMVDLQRDPPPDLVLEVDITHTDLDKNQLYASLGIPEFWRFDGERIQFLVLNNDTYQELSSSPLFPNLLKEDIYHFLQACFLDEMEAEQQLITRIQFRLRRDPG